MKRITITNLVAVENEEASSALLSELFRAAVSSADINPVKFNVAMAALYPDSDPGAASARHNLAKQLAQPNMSLSTFLKGMKLLGVEKLNVKLDLLFNEGTPIDTSAGVAEDGIVTDTHLADQFHFKPYDPKTVDFGTQNFPINLYPTDKEDKNG